MKKIFNLLLLFELGWHPSAHAYNEVWFDTSDGISRPTTQGNFLFETRDLKQAFGDATKNFYWRGSITIGATANQDDDGSSYHNALFRIQQIRSSFPLVIRYYDLSTGHQTSNTQGVKKGATDTMIYQKTNVYFLTIPQTFDIKDVPENIFKSSAEPDAKLNLRCYTACGTSVENFQFDDEEDEGFEKGGGSIASAFRRELQALFGWQNGVFYAGSSLVPTFLKISGMLTDNSPWVLGIARSNIIGVDFGDFHRTLPDTVTDTNLSTCAPKIDFKNFFAGLRDLKILYVNDQFGEGCTFYTITYPDPNNLETFERDKECSFSDLSNFTVYSSEANPDDETAKISDTFNTAIEKINKLDDVTIEISTTPATILQIENMTVSEQTRLACAAGTILELGSNLDLPIFNIATDGGLVVIRSKSPDIHPILRITGVAQKTTDGNVYYSFEKRDRSLSAVIEGIILDANVTFVPQSIPARIFTNAENSILISDINQGSQYKKIINVFPDTLEVKANIHNSTSDLQTLLKGYGVERTQIPLDQGLFVPQNLIVSGNVTFSGDNSNVNDAEHPVIIGDAPTSLTEDIATSKPLKTVVKFEKPESLFKSPIRAVNADITLPDGAIITNDIMAKGGVIRIKNATFRSGRIMLGDNPK